MQLSTAPKEPWWESLGRGERLLLRQALHLIEREHRQPQTGDVVDYSFLVFSAAKAYEGFLKTFFYRTGLISLAAASSDHFRIGKALNPDLPEKYRDEDWIFPEVKHLCGQSVAGLLWQTWKHCRNQTFHYNHGNTKPLSLAQAEARVLEIVLAIKAASTCELEHQTRGKD